MSNIEILHPPIRHDASKNSFWRKLGGGSLTFSIIVHVVLLAIGVFWIFQFIPEKKEDVDFMPNGGGGGQPGAKVDVNMKKRATMTTMNAPRLAAKGAASTFTLPDPEASTAMTSVGSLSSGGLSGGMGGSGSGGGRGSGHGTGFGSGSGPGLGGGAAGMNPFGMIDTSNRGFIGTFYDFKRDKNGKPTGVKALDASTYAKIIQEFTKGRTWREPRMDHYTSPVKLSSRAAFFPGVPDTEAGKAFKSPETQAGMWVAHYTATVTPSVSGTYRFVGWGDNCLVVGINGDPKLDASDHHYLGKVPESVGSANMQGKPSATLFAGEWFQLQAGRAITIDILIGDEGGIFAAGVLIQKKGEDIVKDARGLPNLPILRTTDFSAAEKEALKVDWPEAALKGPVFEVRPGSSRLDI